MAMIRSIETEVLLSNVLPMLEYLKQTLLQIHQSRELFHPVILVFATGHVSELDCIQMSREPMPKIGQRFSAAFVHELESALNVNKRIHDGAKLIQRDQDDDDYYLSAWSLRIVSRHNPQFSEPNLGSAHNSTLSLSIATGVDACCVLSTTKVVFFVDGRAQTLNAIQPSQN